MGVFVIIGIYSLLTTWIMGLLIKFRDKITHMVGMMCAMALGMTIGIGMGTLLAIWLPGQFFHSTLFAIWVGSGIGIVAGLPISLMAVIDGLLSGLMGGMMGTMLMMMISTPYIDVTIKLISVICTGVLFFIFLMIHEEVTPYVTKNIHKVLLYPGSMFLFIIISLGVIVLTGTEMSHPSNHYDHQ